VITVDGLQVRLFVNDGAGNLQTKVVPVPNDAVSVDAFPCAIHEDGLLAVVLADIQPGLTVLHQIIGSAQGGLFDEGPFLAGPFLGPLEFVDLNGDDHLDLVFPVRFQDISLMNVFLGLGQGGFSFVPQSLALPEQFDDTMSVADFDGDGHPDLQYGTTDPDEDHFAHGLANGTFGKPPIVLSIPSGSTAVQRITGDVDGDGRPDVVALIDGGPGPTASSALAVSLNHTYPAGGPITDLGHALIGSHGWPIQLVDGNLVGGTDFGLSLAGAPPTGVIFEVLGFSAVFAPFKGGLLVPSPDVLVGPLIAGIGGTLSLATTWPIGIPPGTSIFLQGWFPDAGGPHGFAATSGLDLIAP